MVDKAQPDNADGNLFETILRTNQAQLQELKELNSALKGMAGMSQMYATPAPSAAATASPVVRQAPAAVKATQAPQVAPSGPPPSTNSTATAANAPKPASAPIGPTAGQEQHQEGGEGEEEGEEQEGTAGAAQASSDGTKQDFANNQFNLTNKVSKIPVVGGMISKIPGVSQALSILDIGGKALDEWQSQTYKDNYYRNIEGGGHISALHERANEEMYSMAHAGVLTDEDAREAFKGVTRLGYTGLSPDRGGINRDDMLNFVTEAKTDRGEDVKEALQQAQEFSTSATAMKDANEQLRAFSKTLTDLSDTASKAGVNTAMARAQFSSMFQMANQSGMGSGSTQFAGSVIQQATALGTAYSQNSDLSAMNSMRFKAGVAATNGMTVNQLEHLSRTDQGAYQSAIDNYQGSWVDRLVTPDMKSWIQDYRTNNPKATAEEIGKLLLDNFSGRPNFPMGTLENWQAMAGQIMAGSPDAYQTVDAAATAVVSRILGENTLSSQKKENPEDQGDSDSSGKDTYPDPNGSAPASKSNPKPYGGAGVGVYGSKGGMTGTSPYPAVSSSSSSTPAPAKAKASDQPKDSGSDSKSKSSSSSASGGSSKSETQVSVKLDLSAEAQRLLKALTVTGGDPYAGANAASNGHPVAPSTNSTR